MGWLRRRFITGLIVTVPLIISVFALAWIFQIIDGFAAPLVSQRLGLRIPGLGLLVTALLVLLVGVVATNVAGKRVLQRAESWLLYIPLFKTVYAPSAICAASNATSIIAGAKIILCDRYRTMAIPASTRIASVTSAAPIRWLI